MRWIMIVLIAIGALLGFFHALIATITHACIRSAPDLYFVSLQMDLLIAGVCLGTAWLIGYFQKDTYAFRGIGTRFYGREETELGYIATKWVTAFLPLLPVRSYLVYYNLEEVSNFEYESQKNVMTPIKGYFHFRQMLRTALISYGTILWCLGCLWLMFMAPCF